jgi:hypothetical protein
VQIAAHFYGLSTSNYAVGDGGDVSKALQELHQNSTLAAVVAANALSALNRGQLIAALHRPGSKNVPLMVVDITIATPPELLKTWSDGAISGCQEVLTAGRQSRYRVGTLENFTRELSGGDLTAQPGRGCALTLEKPKGQSVITLSSGPNDGSICARTESANQELFFDASIEPESSVPPPADAYDQPGYQFASVAPLIMFFRYAAGERAWHTNAHFANLTVDDALLQESYGHLDYLDLLREMQKHHFHTTVAFIPWNFDRSAPQTVAMFRKKSEYFSIAIHGNNHDHQEFPSLKDRALDVQAANIRQAVVRMEKFQSLTQLAYDRVMVFPHSIAPVETLDALKRYNYLATVNSRNIPLGSNSPRDPAFALRPMTLAFATFPSLRRYSAEADVEKPTLALEAFLGNPLLFYVHQGYFAGGAGRFDSIADTVNGLQPGVQWRGLGYIAEHLYLEKIRPDGYYDIKAFTSSLQLDNVHLKDAVFSVEKDEDFRIPFKLFVDGEVYPYRKDGDSMSFDVPILAGRSRQVQIRYQEDLDWNTVDISKSSLRVAGLRYLSEFRDNVVSRSAIGRKVIQGYTANEAWLNRAILMAFMSMVIASVGFWWARKSPGKSNSSRPRESRSSASLGRDHDTDRVGRRSY